MPKVKGERVWCLRGLGFRWSTPVIWHGGMLYVSATLSSGSQLDPGYHLTTVESSISVFGAT